MQEGRGPPPIDARARAPLRLRLRSRPVPADPLEGRGMASGLSAPRPSAWLSGPVRRLCGAGWALSAVLGSVLPCAALRPRPSAGAGRCSVLPAHDNTRAWLSGLRWLRCAVAGSCLALSICCPALRAICLGGLLSHRCCAYARPACAPLPLVPGWTGPAGGCIAAALRFPAAVAAG